MEDTGAGYTASFAAGNVSLFEFHQRKPVLCHMQNDVHPVKTEIKLCIPQSYQSLLSA